MTFQHKNESLQDYLRTMTIGTFTTIQNHFVSRNRYGTESRIWIIRTILRQITQNHRNLESKKTYDCTPPHRRFVIAYTKKRLCSTSFDAKHLCISVHKNVSQFMQSTVSAEILSRLLLISRS